MKKQNLFYYATSELSQDAFLCWLTSFAYGDENDFSDDDKKLRRCAQQLIHSFGVDEKPENIFLSEEPQRQEGHVDVLLTVNGRYKVIIEDKLFTGEHDNQLIRYDQYVAEHYPEMRFRKVYYKLGFESNRRRVYEAGYKYFGMEEIIKVLKPFATEKGKITNAVFQDYFDMIFSFKEEADRFETMPVSEWNWQQINGFYSYMEYRTGYKFHHGFGYVQNKSGGFYGIWFWDDKEKVSMECTEIELYLQCQYQRGRFEICFKASGKDADNNGKQINKSIREKLIWKESSTGRINRLESFGFEKPERYGVGKTVTLGVIRAPEGSYYDAIEALINTAMENFVKCREQMYSGIEG